MYRAIYILYQFKGVHPFMIHTFNDITSGPWSFLHASHLFYKIPVMNITLYKSYKMSPSEIFRFLLLTEPIFGVLFIVS